jgi:hypothetical protein
MHDYESQTAILKAKPLFYSQTLNCIFKIHLCSKIAKPKRPYADNTQYIIDPHNAKE